MAAKNIKAYFCLEQNPDGVIMQRDTHLFIEELYRKDGLQYPLSEEFNFCLPNLEWKVYCGRQNLPTKILMLVATILGCPSKSTDDFSENIELVFLSLIHPRGWNFPSGHAFKYHSYERPVVIFLNDNLIFALK
jgi:hypothetical protein